LWRGRRLVLLCVINGESISENLNAFCGGALASLLKKHVIVGLGMIIEETVSFAMNLVPLLNTGVLVLNINVALDRLGVKITKREYKRKPFRSLFLGLCLILVSSLISIIIQSELAGYQPLMIFAFLLVVFLALAAL
jgi:hypothetical protein